MKRYTRGVAALIEHLDSCMDWGDDMAKTPEQLLVREQKALVVDILNALGVPLAPETGKPVMVLIQTYTASVALAQRERDARIVEERLARCEAWQDIDLLEDAARLIRAQS